MLFDPNWDRKFKAEPWRLLLLEAADLIDHIGWCQRILSDENGRVCAAEALMRVAYAYDVGTDAEVMSRLANFVSAEEHSMAVVKWNDDESRTAAEVTGAMRACARQN
jgi:hypothetical protein